MRETIDEKKHATRKDNKEKEKEIVRVKQTSSLDVEACTVEDSMHPNQHLVLKLH